jgi:hypothetical protein
MPNSPTFDPIGVVMDWIEACRQRRLEDLMDLYADDATVDYCQGGRFEGRAALLGYWIPKLRDQRSGTFQIDAVMPVTLGVSLDYRDYDGQRVRTCFRFDDNGKIARTTCTPLGANVCVLA